MIFGDGRNLFAGTKQVAGFKTCFAIPFGR
jgi:hypothetical protein